MKIQSEQSVVKIIRRLPPDKILQLIENKTETEEEICISEEKWNKLFDRHESKNIMRKMAKEALEDYHGGKTTDIAITEDGRLSPA